MVSAANLRASQLSGLILSASVTVLLAALYWPLMNKVLALSYSESNTVSILHPYIASSMDASKASHRHPRIFPRGPKHSLDDCHIPNGIFQRDRRLTALAYRLREQVALDCVLVANLKLLGSDAASEYVGAVIDED